MSFHPIHEQPPETTPDPAWCTLVHLRKSSRDEPIAVTNGFIARCWGEAPFWQAWRGNRESLLLVGTFNTLSAAVGALR